MKVFVAIIGVPVLIAVISVAGYLSGWWLKEDVVQRGAEIREDTFARQTALQDQMIGDYRDITNINVQLLSATSTMQAPLKAQQKAIQTQFCDGWARLNSGTNLPQIIRAYAQRECF